MFFGRLPKNDFEIVVNRFIFDKAQQNDFYLKNLGIKDVAELEGKKCKIDNFPKKFEIVGIVDKKEPTIYAPKTGFINILNSSQKVDGFGSMILDSTINQEEKVMDYNLYLDDITLKKGRLPKNDYEVIVNIQNRYQMKLNKETNIKVNDKKLKVVGYYESKTGKNLFLVNPNTVKYSVINSRDGITIYPSNKIETINNLRNEHNLNVVDTYEKDRQEYLKKKEESIKGSIIFASIILTISLIEIYLMIRSSFLSRIKEIGTLRAIGVKKSDIYRMFLGEIFAITTIASVPGIVLMTAILKAIITIPYVGHSYIINLPVIILSVLLVYLFNILVGLLPLFKVLRKTPAAILARHDVE